MTTTQQRITGSVRALAAVTGVGIAGLADVLGQSTSSAAKKSAGRVPWTDADVQALARHFGVPSSTLEAGPWSWLGLPDPAESSKSTAA